MPKRESTFVSPDYSDTLPRVQPPAKLPPILAQDSDVSSLIGHTPVRTHERRDPVTEAYGFAIKYAALSIILIVLCIGLTIRLQWHYSIGIVTFAGVATIAYWLLALSENQFSGPGVRCLALQLSKGKANMKELISGWTVEQTVMHFDHMPIDEAHSLLHERDDLHVVETINNTLDL